jgi:hypothetical protein
LYGAKSNIGSEVAALGAITIDPRHHEKSADGRWTRRLNAKIIELDCVSTLKRNGFDRANVDACAAIAARVGVDCRQAIFHRYCIQRTGIDTRFTAGAFFRIYYCCHQKSPESKIQKSNATFPFLHKLNAKATPQI